MTCKGRPKTFKNLDAIIKAQELFWERGYEGSSMSDLIDVMGISRQSMYNTFGNKHGLFIQCLEHYIMEHYEKLCSLFNSELHAKAKLENLFGMMEDQFSSSTSKGCFVSFVIQEMAQKDDQVKKILADKYSQNYDLFLEFFTSAMDKKELKSDLNAKDLTDLFDSILLSTTSLCKLPNRESQISNVFGIFLKQIEFL